MFTFLFHLVQLVLIPDVDVHFLGGDKAVDGQAGGVVPLDRDLSDFFHSDFLANVGEELVGSLHDIFD